jgi:hypothetical protein
MRGDTGFATMAAIEFVEEAMGHEYGVAVIGLGSDDDVVETEVGARS